MTEHEWDEMIDVDARIGFYRPARPFKIYAPTPLAVAITGQISCLSVEHGPGRKIQLGPLWLRRAHQSAENIQHQRDTLD